MTSRERVMQALAHEEGPLPVDFGTLHSSLHLESYKSVMKYLGWQEAADLIYRGICATIAEKQVTYDFARLMPGSTKISTEAFGDRIIHHMSS